jgi:hypothetical protein
MFRSFMPENNVVNVSSHSLLKRSCFLTWKLLKLGHDCFLPYPFQFISCYWSDAMYSELLTVLLNKPHIHIPSPFMQIVLTICISDRPCSWTVECKTVETLKKFLLVNEMLSF